jgi:hypothetical protein
MKATLALWFLIALLFLTACVRPAPGAGSGAEGTPPPVETLPVSPVVEADVSTPAEQTGASSTIPAGIPATFTPVPPTPTMPPPPRLTDTPDPGAILPTATPDPLIEVVKSASAPVVFDAYPSTDGQWVASVVQHRCISAGEGEGFGYEFLRLFNNWEGTERVAADQLFSCGGLGAFGLAGQFWSANNRYFYFTDAREGLPDGCGTWWLQPLLRLDPVTGQVERLGGGPLSPDGGRLATWSGSDLAVWDLNEDLLFRLPVAIGDARRGPIAWSPDGQAIAYLQAAAICPPTGPATLVRVDVAAGSQEVLLVSEAPVFDGLSWESPEAITLRVVEESGRFNLATGTLGR